MPRRLALLYTFLYIILCILLSAFLLVWFKDTFLKSYSFSYIFSAFSILLIIGSLFTYLLSYWLTLLLLSPIHQLIEQVNHINIYKEITLFNEPKEEGTIKELIVSFNHMLLRIKEQYEQQNAFFSSASHELKTPLTVMLTQLQILLNNKNLSQEVRDVYQMQFQETKRLSQLVQDFLLMGEINNQQIQLHSKECDLTDILYHLIEPLKSKLDERNTPIKISYHPIEADYSFISDEGKLNIILSNLLNNATKYSKENTKILIHISKREGSIFINIINTIREDIHPEVTDLNQKFYHSKPLNGEGFGLGLWICKQLSDLLELELFFAIKDQTSFEATLVI